MKEWVITDKLHNTLRGYHVPFQVTPQPEHGSHVLGLKGPLAALLTGEFKNRQVTGVLLPLTGSDLGLQCL